MNHIEAMKQALEALRTLHDENMDYLTRNKLGGENNQCMVFARETITALRQAIEQAEQAQPVAWMHTKLEGVVVPHRPADLNRHPDRWEGLHKTPPPCPTCEALARTVMMDQTAHDTPPRQPLTDEEIETLWQNTAPYYDHQDFARAIEAAHGIKENT
jgi:hypothetical protein